ncbi:hypothetical protein [Adlercreutzia caecimuris]|uniref:hypothetical protein n=2 Tax=Adlercreutzia caecimuris TaxID=671266 RepID=UPI00272B3C93|nr:hypothetical protein [Adlercreutzia caecimuris]
MRRARTHSSMGGSSQVIHNVKIVATRIVQKYFDLRIQAKYTTLSEWITEVEKIKNVAQEKCHTHPRHRSSYMAVYEKVNRKKVTAVTTSIWDLTALRTLVCYMEPFEFRLPHDLLKLFKQIVEDKNFSSHESTQESWDDVIPWEKQALQRISRFVELAAKDAHLDIELRQAFLNECMHLIKDTEVSNRNEYDEAARRDSLVRDEIAFDVQAVVQSSDITRAYNTYWNKWWNRFEDKEEKGIYIKLYYEMLVDKGVHRAAIDLALLFYEGLLGTDKDYNIARKYYQMCPRDRLSPDDLLRYVDSATKSDCSDGSKKLADDILDFYIAQYGHIRLARAYYRGFFVSRDYNRSAHLFNIAFANGELDKQAHKGLKYLDDLASIATLMHNGYSFDAIGANEEDIIGQLEDILKNNFGRLEKDADEDNRLIYRIDWSDLLERNKGAAA